MDAKLMRLAAERLEAGEEMAIVTVIASDAMKDGLAGAIMAIDQYGQILGGGMGSEALTETVRCEAEKCLIKGASRKVLVRDEDGSRELFVNVSCRKDPLIIVGSGSLVADIYQIALMIGYGITIIDNRPETLVRARFPQAGRLILGDIVESLKGCEIDENTSIILASRHHKWDLPALEAIIDSPARYIGVLGNKRKVTAYFSELNRMGVSEESMSKVHIPVGLDIGGQKTAEIALAVVAEMQAVKYGRPGGFFTIKNITRIKEKREELF